MDPFKRISGSLSDVSISTIIVIGAVWFLLLTAVQTFGLIFSANSSNGVSYLLQSGKTKTNRDVQYLTTIVKKQGSLLQKQSSIIHSLKNVQNFDHKQTQRQLTQTRNGTKIIAQAILSIETHLDQTLQADIRQTASDVEKQVLIFDQTVLVPALEKALSHMG